MKTKKQFSIGDSLGGFAYISENEIQTFYNTMNFSENISEHKSSRRKLNKTSTSTDPGVERKRGRPRKNNVPAGSSEIQRAEF